MKYLFSFFFSISAAFILNGQTIVKDVIAGGGLLFEAPSISLLWTLGESTTRYYDTGALLQEGFHSGSVKLSSSTIDNWFEEASTLDASAFPNPFDDVIQISLEENVNATVQLFSSQGLLLKSANFNQHLAFPASDLPAGIYLIKIFGDRKVYESKLIKS